MRRFLAIFLLLALTSVFINAQTNEEFNPATPSEPAQKAKVYLSVSPSEAGTVTGGGACDVGSSTRIYTTSAGSQWKFVRWKKRDSEETVNTNSSFYYTVPSGISYLVAEYVELPRTELVLLCAPKEANASLSGAGNYIQDSRISVSANTISNFTFKNWTNAKTGAVVSTSRSFYFYKTAVADTLQANYVYSPSLPSDPQKPVEPIVYHKVSVAVNNPEFGSVSSTGATVEVGKTFTVSAYNKDNYVFLGWLRDDAVVSTASTYTLTMGKKDVALTALFEFSPGTPDEPLMSNKQPDGPVNPEPDVDPEPEPDPDNPTGESTIPGDVNGDFRVNNVDLAMVMGYITGHEYFIFIKKNADVNKDGRINVIDVACIVSIILKNIL